MDNQLTKQDIDTVSGIVAKYGYIEWSLLCFTPQRDYNVFSLFSDPSIMPIFRAVLFSMLKRLDEYCLSKDNRDTEIWH